VHDAVRPLVSRKLVELLYTQATSKGNAIPSVPVKDSMRVQKNGENEAVNRLDYLSFKLLNALIYKSLKRLMTKFRI
jgi:2-C-methyl-D-erythritol 4-phosphate cytidylyltransferase